MLTGLLARMPFVILLRRVPRRALGAVVLVLAAVLSPAPGVLAAAPAGPAPATLEATGVPGALRPLPPNAAPFDAAGRAALAMDLLTYFVRQQGLFPGRTVYLLPAAPWFGGYESPSPRRAWDMAVPAGAPLYLLAAASDQNDLDPSLTSVLVNGAALPDLSAYKHTGVHALSWGQMREFTVLDLVFAPPSAGHYQIEVHSRAAPSADESVLSYDVTVQAPDSLGPALWRDQGGTMYATMGEARRRVPDAETLSFLGYAPYAVLEASPDLLAALPEGPALPALHEGMLVRDERGSLIFRLHNGQRIWIADASGLTDAELASVTGIEAPVLQTIPLQLRDGMLLKGAAADVYHVDRGSLRKIPDWKWAVDHGLDPAKLIYVPDRLIQALPQNSPEWAMPAGSWMDRAFYSAALGRWMPYRVYLPPSYNSPDQAGTRYPVLYLLHGLGGRYDEWSGYGVEEVANQLYDAGSFGDIIMVAPQGGLGYWMNQDGGTPWGDYVARDLVAHVDATYRTIPRREARALGGISMGAHGALQLALNYPDVFSIVGAHSPSLRDQSSAPAYFGTGATFARHDPLSLVRDSSLSSPPQIWIDAGQNDFWRPSAEALHQALLDRGWPHEWHVYPGEHDGWYWGDHLWDYLPFYSAAFDRNGTGVHTRTPPAARTA